MPTITAAARMVVRLATREQVFIRAARGWELMQVIGWEVSEYTVGHPLDGNLLTSLAGNAFSAFACCPFAIASMAVYGRADVRKPDVVEVGDDGSSQD